VKLPSLKQAANQRLPGLLERCDEWRVHLDAAGPPVNWMKGSEFIA
jgi:hypothetical protein